MIRHWAICGAVACVLGLLEPRALFALSPASTVVRDVLAPVNSAGGLAAAALARRIDGEAVARRLVGAAWDKSEEAERAEFAGLIAEIFARRLAGLLAKASSAEMTGEEAVARGDALIRSVVTSEGRKHNIQWQLRESGKVWRIVDVFVDGASAVLARAGQIQQELRANDGRLAAVSAVLRARLARQPE